MDGPTTVGRGAVGERSRDAFGILSADYGRTVDDVARAADEEPPPPQYPPGGGVHVGGHHSMAW